MIAAYPLCWMVSINKGLREENSSWYWIGYISLGIGASFISLCFIIYAILLLRYISKPEPTPGNCDAIFSSNGRTFHENITPRDSGNDRDWLEFSSIESNSMLNEPFKFELIMTKKKSDKSIDKYFVELTREDKRIVMKLLTMTTISGTAGLLIIAIGTPFTLYDILTSPSYTYLSLFLALIFEFGICLLIIIAFTTQVKNQEKENIKQMIFMARNIRKSVPDIRIPSKFNHISRRLRLYYL